MKKLLVTWIIVQILFFSTANAAIQTYEGIGEYPMTDETVDFAKNKAELSAQRDALEKISTYVKKTASMTDHELDSEEIITISAGILRVIETKFLLAAADDGIIVTAFVTAEIDTDELKNLLEQAIKERKGE
ncbi:MAG: hypothetical protein II857_00030 [Selenomonadaceae bacterium]|nr:hypothetical protein [Selenomonadaceae bacterium]